MAEYSDYIQDIVKNKKVRFFSPPKDLFLFIYFYLDSAGIKYAERIVFWKSLFMMV